MAPEKLTKDQVIRVLMDIEKHIEGYRAALQAPILAKWFNEGNMEVPKNETEKHSA